MLYKKRFKLIKSGSRIDCFFKEQLGSSLFTYGAIFSMLLPLIIDVFFVNLINLLTTAMISSSSQESVSAVSLVNPLGLLIFAVFSSISAGGTVVVAQYKGKKNEKKLKTAAGQVILATSLVAIFSSAVLILLADPLIHWMFGNGDTNVLIKATDYLIGIAISLIFLSIYMGVFAIFRGIGETKLCLYLTIIINFTHLIASFFFINIFKLDIIGTSLSLNIARILGAIIAIYLVMKRHSVFRINLKDIFSFHWPILKSILFIGIPFAFEQLFFYGGSVLVQTFIVKLGTSNVAAHAIANSVLALLISSGIAVSTLAITIIAQCIGSGHKDLAKKYGGKMIWLTTCMIVLSLAILLPLMPFILRLYQAPTETLSIIYQLLLIMVIPIPFFWSIANVMPAVLRAAGDSIYSSVVALITMWLIRVGLGYILTFILGLGVYGFAFTIGIEWFVKTIIFMIRFRSGKWLDKNAIK